MANKSSLVEQIKAIQRSDPEAKQAWWDYCDQRLGGVKDPNRHDAQVLEEFLSMHGSGGAGGKSRGGGGYGYGGGYDGGAYGYAQGGWGGYAGGYGASQWTGEGSMATMVKTGQRRSQHWKTAWQAYCSLYGNNYNDPARYDENFLVGFIDYVGQLATADLGHAPAPAAHVVEGPVGTGVKRPLGGGAMGAQPPAKRAAGAGAWGEDDEEKKDLVERIKALQRSDPEAKTAWWRFCDEFQQGVKDPNRHETATLQKFLQGYEE